MSARVENGRSASDEFRRKTTYARRAAADGNVSSGPMTSST
jgi:hypothetical protein